MIDRIRYDYSRIRKDLVFRFPSLKFLPEVNDSGYWEKEIFRRIGSGNLRKLRQFVQYMGYEGIQFSPDEALRDIEEAHLTKTPTRSPFSMYPLEEVENRMGYSPVGFAKFKRFDEIAEYLEYTIDEANKNWMKAYNLAMASKGTAEAKDETKTNNGIVSDA